MRHIYPGSIQCPRRKSPIGIQKSASSNWHKPTGDRQTRARPTSMASTTGQGFSIGISAEQQLSMPLGASASVSSRDRGARRRFLTGGSGAVCLSLSSDSIIKQAKKAAPKAKKPVPVKLKQHNVKKTVVVPVSKAAVRPLSLLLPSWERL